ncbi:DUF5107 domain-containing protein [Poritiphilus flavus]|uniref:DUF5107 domain-containing protein n=1 Tax=Poritiphilus flavus TaxID=2697053 RepID=A0A6L9E7P0_9FLAO|nr:DUF5107 domain-containing protein [Poritiphilus flavus]NAS10469.1 DUF5107 domain-containing protein [Poritiphilus flavus]
MNLNSSLYFLITAFLLVNLGYTQSVSIREEVMSLDTYAFKDPNPVPILVDNPKIYPYFKFEVYGHESRKQDWKVVTLENEYIKVFVLPEIGGKVWGAIEKSTGEEFLYKNEVVKFRNIAMRGPWTSGGIEFNFGIIGHTPATATPVDYVLKNNEDGSVSCIVGNMDLPSRTLWRVEIRLEKDKAYFETNASWNNPTSLNQSYYNWMTAAAEARQDLEFFIPGDQYLEHGGDPHAWPVDDKNRNLAFYRNNNFGPSKSYHIVGDYQDFFGGYYHDKDFGFGHWAPYEQMPGQKLWLWALSRSGGIWEDLLTDTDGQYIEFQAGRLFNQYFPGAENPVSQANFEPLVMDRWEEIWFPIKEIGGMEAANRYGVINVEWEDGEFFIGLNALQPLSDKMQVLHNGKHMFSESLDLDPMGVFTTSLPGQKEDTLEIIIGEKKLYYTNKAERTALKRPFETEADISKSPLHGVFHVGWEAMKYREFKKAYESFAEIVSQDPSNIRAWSKLAELAYRKGDPAKAIHYANKALELDTYDAEANYLAGITYRELKDQVNALESLGWAARSMQFRSAAYAQMAEIYYMMKDRKAAGSYSEQALNFNAYNSRALELLELIYREKGDTKAYEKANAKLLEIDPLNNFAKFEKVLKAGSISAPALEAMNIQNEFPQESVLELAIKYYSLGLTEEALSALEIHPDDSKIRLWKAYLLKESDSKSSVKLLKEVVDSSSDFVFPYRPETLQVLKWATEQDEHWKLKWYLAQNTLALGQEEEGKRLMKAVGNTPDNPTFYRFRARLFGTEALEEGIADYESALKLNNADWKGWEEYILYNLDAGRYSEAFGLSSKAARKFSGNYNIELSHAKAALMVGKYELCIAILRKINILPFEHASESKRIFNRAHLFLASELMNQKKFQKAAEILTASKEWPENLGVGKPYDVDTREQDYLLGVCHEKLGQQSEARSFFEGVADHTLKNSHHQQIRHLFGLLALRKLQNSSGENELLSALESSADSKNNINKTVLALFKDQSQLLTSLKSQGNMEENYWSFLNSAMAF